MGGEHSLVFERYAEQVARWPQRGKHILAQYDAESVVVYQAYNREIGEYAVRHGRFGAGFSGERMSWIKPNFLWMMYRSGWGTKANQEMVLAIRIGREHFDSILRQAVHSTFRPRVYSDAAAWKLALAASPVRLQWDPDHDPVGGRVERRAIQLGLSGDVLRAYAREWPMEILDMSDFVAAEREHVGETGRLRTPREEVYRPDDPGICQRLELDA